MRALSAASDTADCARGRASRGAAASNTERKSSASQSCEERGEEERVTDIAVSDALITAITSSNSQQISVAQVTVSGTPVTVANSTQRRRMAVDERGGVFVKTHGAWRMVDNCTVHAMRHCERGIARSALATRVLTHNA